MLNNPIQIICNLFEFRACTIYICKISNWYAMKRIAQLYKRPSGEYNSHGNNKMRKYQHAQNVYYICVPTLTLVYFGAFFPANHTVEKPTRCTNLYITLANKINS